MQLYRILAALRPGNPPRPRRTFEHFSGGLPVLLAHGPIDRRWRIGVQLRGRYPGNTAVKSTASTFASRLT